MTVLPWYHLGSCVKLITRCRFIEILGGCEKESLYHHGKVVITKYYYHERDGFMADYIALQLDDNTQIYIETTDSSESLTVSEGPWDEGVTSASDAKRIIHRTKDYFDAAMDQVKIFSRGVIEQFKDVEHGPNEIEVEFSVKFGIDAGAIITSVSSESSLTFHLKWIR